MDEQELVPTEEVAEEVATEEAVPVDDPTPPVEDTTDDDAPQLPPPKKRTAQERIDELTKARRTAEREAEKWKEEALRAKEDKQPTPTASTEPSRPVISNFDTTEAYEDALIEWHDARKAAKTRAAEIQQRNEETLRTFNEKDKPLREQYDDFDEVVEAPVFTAAMRLALLNSDNGPMVAYFLGRPENIDTAEKIKRLPVERQLYELGKLETSLLVAQKTKKVSGAPPPINPVGGAGGTGAVDESKLSDDEWYKLEQQRNKEKLKKKYGG